MKNKWHYTGDINLEHGGLFINMNFDCDYADVVRVTPMSDAGGPDNVWWVEAGSVSMPSKLEELEQVLKYSGLKLENVLLHPEMIVEAIVAYKGLEVDAIETVQIGPTQESKAKVTATVQLRNRSKLENYVRREFLAV